MGPVQQSMGVLRQPIGAMNRAKEVLKRPRMHPMGATPGRPKGYPWASQCNPEGDQNEQTGPLKPTRETLWQKPTVHHGQV